MLISSLCQAQDDESDTLRMEQFASKRVQEAFSRYNDSAAREFRRKSISWPPHDVYIRVFKWQNELELWARNNETAEYRLVKTYRICAISGLLGPKRAQGDHQVPEGFYFIEDFNPASDYCLSMQLNYPNYADQIQGNGRPGGDIFIHGGCVTVGCVPMTDEVIKELYTICLNARLNGQQYIPVHIFPTRLSASGMTWLKREFSKDHARQQFWSDLKPAYDFFERHHKLLPVMYTPDGRYAY